MPARPEPYRWTVEKAATEFGIDRRTLTKRLRQESIEPGKDGKYSTADIASTIYGDLEGERTLLTKAQRRREEIKLAKEKEQVIDAEIVRQTWESIIVPAKQKFMGLPSKMESRMGLSEAQRKQLEAEVDDILNDLAKPPDYNESAILAETDSEDASPVGTAATSND